MSSIKLLGLVASLLFIAGSVRADSTATLSFSGTVDLSSVGGATSNTFTGSFTWNPSTTPFNTASGPGGEVEAEYTPISYSFALNSTDITALTGNPVIIVDYHPGEISDFVLAFNANEFVGFVGINNNYLYAFGANFITSPNVFNGASLPSNLNFLNSLSSTSSLWDTYANSIGFPNPQITGTLTSPSIPAPEPATKGLLIIGIGLAFVMQKRKSLRLPSHLRSVSQSI